MAHEHQPIRVTPTHSGPDSKGIVSVFGWDLEGMVAFYLVAGGAVGLLVVFSLASSSIFVRLAAGLLPVAISVVWVRLFVHGRPPAYQSDVWERWFRGTTFRLSPFAWGARRHPQAILLAKLAEREAHHA